jgi:hypothetical protein
MELRRTALWVALVLAAASRAAPQEPSLATILQRAGAYVDEFEHQLSSIVAEESYTQRLQRSGPRFVQGPGHREMQSDLLLVKPAGSAQWMQYRDVFEVDGNLIRDRDQRLVRLFLQPPASVAAQKAAILKESARYNIGSIQRTLNTPVLALSVLEPANQARFTFRRANDRRPFTTAGAKAAPGYFRVTTEMWVIGFEETRRETLIRTTEGKDVKCRGRFWVEPSTGRILMSELVVNPGVVKAIVDVSYQSEPLLGLLVPVEMSERYETVDGERVEGTATYGRFRQFQVKVDETLGPIKK